MNKEEIEKLAGRVIMKMNLKKEGERNGWSQGPSQAQGWGSDSPQRRSIWKDFVAIRNTKRGFLSRLP